MNEETKVSEIGSSEKEIVMAAQMRQLESKVQTLIEVCFRPLSLCDA